MYGNSIYEAELAELLEADEAYDEADESDESDEASDERVSRRAAPRKVPTAGRGNVLPSRPAQGFATKAELATSVSRLDAKIATNSKAIQAVDGRVRTLTSELGKARADLKKEQHLRKTQVDQLNKSLDDVRQVSMLLPLLSTQQTKQAYVADSIGGSATDGVNMVVDNGDNLSKMLPILLLGGLGSSSSSSSSGGLFGGGSSDNSMMMLALVMMMNPK